MIGLALAIVLEVARLVALAPAEAASAAARIGGRPDLAAEVLALARVESRLRPVGIHRGHAPRRPGRAFWGPAVRVGWLDPEACPEHQLADGERWGIRGILGLAAAYSVRHLWRCAAPEVLDVPIVSAIVAVRRLGELERRYGLRDRRARAEAWRRGVASGRGGRR